MNILVTGASSQISKTLENNYNNDENLYFLSKDKLDITIENQINNNFNKIKPNVVINCAAYTNVKEAEFDKKNVNQVNNLSLKKLSLACNKYNSLLIHFSTDYVFDGKNKKKYKETENTNPNSFYGISKLRGENQIIKFCNSYIIFRVSWLYSLYKNNFLKFVLEKFINDEDIYAVNDLYSIPTSSYELARFLNNSENYTNKENLNQIYHFVGNGSPITWFDFAVQILKNYNKFKKTKSKILPISSYDFFQNKIRPQFSSLDNSKFTQNFNFKIDNWKNSLNETMIKLFDI